MEYTGSGKGRRGQQSGLIAPTVNDSLRIGLASPTMQTATTSPTVTTPGTDSTLHVGLASPALAGTTASSSGYGTYQYQKGKPNATVPDTTATDTTGTTGTTTVTGATDTTSRRQGRRGGGGGSAANNGGILSTNTATRTPTTRTTTSTTTATTKPEMFTPMQINENQTVAGQLNALLSDDSKYIQNARMRAMETANERGLLNSSIAAGAGERAAIEAGLPIAQNDAQSYFTTGQNATTAGYNYKLNEQNIAGNLKIAEAKAKADAALQAANNAAALERVQAQSAADLAKVQEQAKINAEAEQPGRVDPVTGQYIPGGYKFEAEKALKELEANINLSATEKQNAQAAYVAALESGKNAIMNIEMQPGLGTEDKEKALEIINNDTATLVNNLAPIYHLPLDYFPTYTPATYTGETAPAEQPEWYKQQQAEIDALKQQIASTSSINSEVS